MIRDILAMIILGVWGTILLVGLVIKNLEKNKKTIFLDLDIDKVVKDMKKEIEEEEKKENGKDK